MSDPAVEAPARRQRVSALPPFERRSMIVAAALPLVLEHGDRVTSRQIAAAAGIAEGTIFRAFADKDEVIEAVLEAALDTAPTEARLRAIPEDLPFVDTVVAATVIAQERVIMTWRVISSVSPRYHENVRRPMADSEALIAVFERHRDQLSVEPVAAARLLRAFVFSTTHPMLAPEPMGPAAVVQLFLHGVGATDVAPEGIDAPC
jgi:AcrR family transcriptional regulator